MKEYVLGFMFNSKDEVLLMLKLKGPNDMEGKFNGIGGKIEEDESPIEAMDRETFEETIYKTKPRWFKAGEFYANNKAALIHVFATSFQEYENSDIESKEVEIVDWFPLAKLPSRMMYNLHWLLPLCWHHMKNQLLEFVIDEH